jgi:hypothetical protein
MNIFRNFVKSVHRLTVKFVKAFLPGTENSYHLRACNQPTLSMEDVAAKASLYKLAGDPKAIVDGFTSFMELALMLAVEGAKVKTPFFTLHIGLPGVYHGNETGLLPGKKPQLRLLPSQEMKKLVADKLEVVIDGKLQQDSFITSVYDRATGRTNEVITPGRVITVTGTGLKVGAEEALQGEAGVFFECPEGSLTQAMDIIRNEAKTLSIQAPHTLLPGTSYRIVIKTQTSPAKHSSIVKEMRTVRSEAAYLAA